MTHKRIADSLGIGHSKLQLSRGKSTKSWLDTKSNETGPEEAVLSHYQKHGWVGHAQEGGLILSLIKAASFDSIPTQIASVFIEALYHHNMAFTGIRYETEWLLRNLLHAEPSRIKSNFLIMSRLEWGVNGEAGCQFFSTVNLKKILGLHAALGNARLHAIASIFATAPYDYRAGWPDITMWKDGKVVFREIKAPGDRLHASQRRLMGDILVPLGYDVEIVDIVDACHSS